MRNVGGNACTDALRYRSATTSRKAIAANSSSSNGNARLPALYSGASSTNTANDQKNVEPAGSTLPYAEEDLIELSWG